MLCGGHVLRLVRISIVIYLCRAFQVLRDIVRVSCNNVVGGVCLLGTQLEKGIGKICKRTYIERTVRTVPAA